MSETIFFIDKIAFPANYPDPVRSYLPERTIERGDILALWSPEEPGLQLVKRVIGLPEETLEIRGWDVFIDGRMIDEPYTVHNNPIPGHRHDFGPVQVPPDRYFMMGDNRDNSNDSRFWGFASREELIGRTLFIFWSYETSLYDPNAWSIADRAKHYGSVALHYLHENTLETNRHSALVGVPSGYTAWKIQELKVCSKITSQNWRPGLRQIWLRPIEQTGEIASYFKDLQLRSGRR